MRDVMRRGWVMGLVGVPVLAWAQAPVAGNLTPVPMATLAGQVTRQIASGGLAGVPLDQATVSGLSLTATIGKLVPKTAIGAASGVSGLDANGNATAPVNTTGAMSSATVQNFGSSPAWAVLPSDLMSGTTLTRNPLISANYQWNNDQNEHPNTFMIGGHQPFQGGSLSLYGAPWSYGNVGALVDIEMTNTVWASSRSGSGDFDALSQYIEAANTTPYYKVGQDFTDDTGATHSLTFDANGMTVSPVLPASFMNFWNSKGATTQSGSGIFVITNLMQSQPNVTQAIPGFPQQNVPNLWSGYITGITQGTNSTHLNMAAGWHPSSAWAGAHGTNNNSVPDQSVGLDQLYYPQYTHPIAIIGTYMQAFDQNMFCFINKDSGTSPNTTLVRNDSPMRSCQANEADFGLSTNLANGEAHIQGFTAHIVGALPLPSPDSMAFVAQGNWPTAIAVGLGTDGREFSGNVLAVNSRRGPAGTIGDTTEIMETRQGGDAPTDNRSNDDIIRITQKVDTISGSPTATRGTHFPSDNSVHLGEWIGGPVFGTSGATLGQYGNYVSEMVFNPGWDKGGIALCGQANQYHSTGSSCLSVLPGGQLVVNPNQTAFGVGMAIDPSGLASGASGASGLTVGTMPANHETGIGIYLPSGYLRNALEVMAGSSSLLTLDGSGNAAFSGNVATTVLNAQTAVVAPSVITASGVGPAYPAFTFANLPASGLVDGQHARCSDCKLNGHTGVDAVWNAGAAQWTDMMDNALSH